MNQTSTRIAFGILVLACVVAAGVIVWPFVPALLWAATFSILLYPWFKRLTEKRKWKPTWAALAATAVPTLLLIVPAIVTGTVAGVQVYGYVNDLMNSSQGEGGESIANTIGAELNRALEPLLTQFGATDINVQQLIAENEATIARNLTGPLTEGLKSFVVTIVTLVISLLTTFFMIRDSHHLLDPLCDLVPLPREETVGILQRMAKTVRSVFYAVVVVALIQGAVMGVTYVSLGVDGWLVWTLVTTVLCMIPLLGAPMVIVPLAATMFLRGDTVPGLILLGVGFGIVTQIDNFLRPVFISGETKIHTMAIFFALLGGVLVLGPVGLMAGPMLLTLVLAFVDVVRVRKRLEEKGELEPLDGGAPA